MIKSYKSLLLASLSVARRTASDTLIAFSPISQNDRNRNVKHLWQCLIPPKLFFLELENPVCSFFSSHKAEMTTQMRHLFLSLGSLPLHLRGLHCR